VHFEKHTSFSFLPHFLSCRMILENQLTPRLRFRSLKLADKDALMEFFSDPAATEFLFPQVPPEEFADAWISRQTRRYEKSGTGLCAITQKDTNELVGQCGLLLQFVDGIPKLEIGYHFIRRFWGQGFATEAAAACRDFAFENELAETVISLIHPNNFRSQAVARRIGMTPWKETVWRGNPVVVFRIKREDWEKRTT
jgi:RimJ/RimL family protein N-acetyltransferase